MNGQNTRVGPNSGAGHELPQESRPRGIIRLAWLPIPLLALAIILGRAAGLNESYKSETLTLVLSFTFYTLVSLGTLFLIGRSFLASGTPGLLLMECGVILWSLAGTVGDAVSHGNANVNVTIFNTSILLAGLCHLAGAIFSLRPQRGLRAPRLWLGVGCAFALCALWLVTLAALRNWLPVFFIPGQGGTLVRYCVLISAISMFVLSATLLLAGRRETRAPFTSWYALALLLLAVGLFGVMVQLSLGSVVNWLGRTAQWLGGVYLLLAALTALRESDLPLLPPKKELRPQGYRYWVAIAIVLAATALRLVFLPTLGTRNVFLTFYPAVMLAALYGGLRPGLLALALSSLIADYFWMEPLGQFTIGSPTDWLSLIIFLLSGSLIAWIGEAMLRASARASSAETQILLAAEREAAAEVLRKSEERYHTLFTGMTEGFATHELLTDESGRPVDYRFLDVNPAFERLTGLKREDVVGKTHNEVLPGNDPTWLLRYSPVALTGKPVQFENYAPTLERYYEVVAYRPAPMQFAVIFTDISERKQAAEKMREARAAAINLMEDAIEARQQTERVNEKLQQEIVERKQAEEAVRESEGRLAQALRIANVGTWEWDLQTGNASWCDRMYRMFGEERESFIPTYESFLNHIHAEDRQKVDDIVRDALAKNGSYEIEYRIIADTTSPRVILTQGEVVSNPAGQPLRVIGTALDLTARKQMEEELRKSYESLELRVQERTAELKQAYDGLTKEIREREQVEAQLRQSQKMEALGTLSGGIAHDFNNILAAIIGFTELLAGHAAKGSRDERHLARVMEAGIRGRELVRQMLTFSRKTEQEKKPLQLSSIVKETVTLIRATTPTTISVRVKTLSDSAPILGDPTQMQQVVMNLCTNASYAMRENGGVLDIELTDFCVPASDGNAHGIEPGSYVKLTVRDTGTGMSSDTLERIFDPFFTTKKLGEGSGLGLSVVHGIVKQHDGHIIAESEPGKGSTFTLYLPKITGAPETAAISVDALPTGSERILFVDDEELLVEVGEDILAELGYEVTSRMSSIEALALFKSDPLRFDLVMTDQTMPEMTGVELAKELLTIRADIPIIMCTGFSYVVDADKASAAGIKAFAMKPLTKKEIAQTVRKVLDE